MATADAVEKHIPVREGDYGDAVVAVEPGGVEYIPLRERHGKPIDLFWTWLSPNLEFATVFIGCLAVFLFGANFWVAALGIIVGSALGSLTHWVLSSWGPRFGVPQMVQNRGAFGFFGNLLPAGLNTFTAIFGWFVVNSVSGAFALGALGAQIGLSLPFWSTFAFIVILQVLVAFFGHNLIHAFERIALIPLGIVFALACVFMLGSSLPHIGGGGGSGNQFAAFIFTTATAFGYAAGWNPYASDYTRYQRPDVDRRMVGFWAGFGVFLSCVVLELAGAALVLVPGTKWGINDIPTAQMSHAMPSILYTLTLLMIALGAVAANAINIYSGAMSFLTLGLNLSLKQRRAMVAIAAGVVGLIIGIAGQANVGPGSKYESFMLVIAYWLAAWLGVTLTDYWMRRGNFGDEEVFFDRSYNSWQGVVSMLVALIVSIGLFADQEIYTGPIAKSAGLTIGDITPIVGFVLAAVLYYVLRGGRIRVDVKGEEVAGAAARA
jgi:purine-cytosine permease-like protein